MPRTNILAAAKVLAALAVLAGATTYVLGVWPFAGKLEETAQGQGQALIGGPFSLVAHTGERVTDADFAGRAKLMYFGYTYCPDMCPLGLGTITAAYGQLSPAQQDEVVPIFVTVDPERDTVPAMADYVALFHPDLVGLTGTVEEVGAAASAYRVYHRKAESESNTDYLVDHSTFIYLMDGDNAYVTHFGHDASAEEVAEGVRRHLGAAG
jgi:protein SCO1/2